MHMKRLRAIALGTAWYLSWASFLLFRPILGSIVLLGIAGAFAWLYLLRSAHHVTPKFVTQPWGQLRWLALGVAAYLVADLCAAVLYVRVAGLPRAETAGGFDAYARRPLGWLPLTTLAVVVGPLMEEWLFRGVLLQALRERVGVATAIAVSAILFAAAHLSTWAFPMHLFFGIAAGILAVASGSLWPSIALHAITNATDPVTMRIVTAASAMRPARPAYVLTEVLAVLAALAAGAVFMVSLGSLRRLCIGTSCAPVTDADDATRHISAPYAVHSLVP
jgi:membrane protease YdiL (CAAX protease family)